MPGSAFASLRTILHGGCALISFRRSLGIFSIFLPVTACFPEDSSSPPVSLPASGVGVDLNDVSILLSPPQNGSDPAIAITDLSVASGDVWSDKAFAEFLAIAGSGAGAVAVEDVANNDEIAPIDVGDFANKADWHIASIRVDPGAPGLSPEMVSVFGRSPQIRLVLQPVTDGDVHDVTAHLIFSYTKSAEPVAGCLLPKLIPNDEAFQTIIDDVVALKTRLAKGEIGDQPIGTTGDLRVHPADDPAKVSKEARLAFHGALKAFLEKHLNAGNLSAMAVMALPRRVPEPWIFVAMAQNPGTGGFVPFPNPALKQDDRLRFAQMLDVRPGVSPRNPSVSPLPVTNNLNPIDCAFEVPVDPGNPDGPKPPANPRGVSTAELFPDGDAARMREIVTVIADPAKAHFFNTDCVSCHTETRREMDILGTDSVDAPVDPTILPKELWNVRNFGWFPSFLNDDADVAATATRRTAAETREVVEAINARLRTQ